MKYVYFVEQCNKCFIFYLPNAFFLDIKACIIYSLAMYVTRLMVCISVPSKNKKKASTRLLSYKTITFFSHTSRTTMQYLIRVSLHRKNVDITHMAHGLHDFRTVETWRDVQPGQVILGGLRHAVVTHYHHVRLWRARGMESTLMRSLLVCVRFFIVIISPSFICAILVIYMGRSTERRYDTLFRSLSSLFLTYFLPAPLPTVLSMSLTAKSSHRLSRAESTALTASSTSLDSGP